MERSNVISLILFAVVFTASAHHEDNYDSPEVSRARQLMHQVDWISIATISTLEHFNGYPFNNIKSVADGPKSSGSGIPYLLMTDIDFSGADVKVNNSVTLLASLASTNDCSEHGYDPQDPRCGRLILSGKLLKMDENTEEYNFAKNALFERHPVMKEWIYVHDFYFAKVSIENILFLDYFGGANNIDVETYLNAPSPDWITEFGGRNEGSATFII